MALLALALTVGAPAAADELSPYGVNVHAPGGAQLVAQLDRVERGGIGWVRIDFIWAAIQPQRGVYEWQHYDALVNAAQQRGLSILAIVAYTPAWATDGAEISGVPRDVEDWKAFCTRAAKRYRGRIAAWELWNEPNLAKFWAGSRQQYWQQILIPGADAIKAADPQALIAGPALAHLQSREWHHWLLETLQTAGSRLDVVTHHLYDGDGADDVTEKLDGSTQFGSKPSFWSFIPPSVREVLKEANARDKPFWLTETGWESGDVGESRQASEYRGLLGDWLAGAGTRTWVQKVFFYELQDGTADLSWGLLRADGSPKPAYTAFRDFTAEHPVAPPLELHDGRFAVQATWRTADGQRGLGRPLSFSRESGRFWFFAAGNTELVVKVLDAAPVNGKIWVFWGALSDVEYWLTVVDRMTGDIRRYHNAPGTLCGGADTKAFASPPAALASGSANTTAPWGVDGMTSPLANEIASLPVNAAIGAGAPWPGSPTPAASLAAPAIDSSSWLAASMPIDATAERFVHAAAEHFAALSATTAAPMSFVSDVSPMSVVAPAASCLSGPQALCLAGDRFRVEGSWQLPSGVTGPARAVSADAESGSFWFFGPDNLELAVKVLDGRPLNGRFWVFFGALSDVRYQVTVTDTTTGAVRSYDNPAGTLCGRADTAAF